MQPINNKTLETPKSTGIGQNLVDGGLFNYYKSPEAGNYMPGHLIIVYLVKQISNAFVQPESVSGSVLVFRLPSIIADCVIAYLAYRFAGKNKIGKLPALMITAVSIMDWR